MKIPDEDFDLNEGMDRYKDDKMASEYENYLKCNPDKLYALISEVIETFEREVESISEVLDVVLKGEYFKSPVRQEFYLHCYSEGYIEFKAVTRSRDEKILVIRWDGDWSSISYTT